MEHRVESVKVSFFFLADDVTSVIEDLAQRRSDHLRGWWSSRVEVVDVKAGTIYQRDPREGYVRGTAVFWR